MNLQRQGCLSARSTGGEPRTCIHRHPHAFVHPETPAPLSICPSSSEGLWERMNTAVCWATGSGSGGSRGASSSGRSGGRGGSSSGRGGSSAGGRGGGGGRGSSSSGRGGGSGSSGGRGGSSSTSRGGSSAGRTLSVNWGGGPRNYSGSSPVSGSGPATGSSPASSSSSSGSSTIDRPDAAGSSSGASRGGRGSGRGGSGGRGGDSSSRGGSSSGSGASGGAGGSSGSRASSGRAAADARWRVFQVVVPYATDPGKDDMTPSRSLASALGRRLLSRDPLPASALHVVRKSFDSRPSMRGMRAEKRWVYVVDVEARAAEASGADLSRLLVGPGQIEMVTAEAPHSPPPLSGTSVAGAPGGDTRAAPAGAAPAGAASAGAPSGLVVPAAKAAHPVVIVGSGPAGLFAALTAARGGLPVVLLEKGQPVEQRGRDIGALLVRGLLNPDSNLCYGEGGAGTWSDGKLATKIGRNSDPVRAVLQALVDFGAPDSILVAGKPHLGTDRLVLILKQMRGYLMESLGAQIRFGTSVEDLEVTHGRVTGVKLAGTGEVIKASCVVLAVGHSARAMYRRLEAQGVALTPKPFAMGFRLEHPQSLIDTGRYGEEHAAQVLRGKGKIPVADYKLNVEVADDTYTGPSPSSTYTTRQGDEIPRERRVTGQIGASDGGPPREKRVTPGGGAAVEEYGGTGRSVPAGQRSVFSFCMCPGGQIVCTSTRPDELCLNGMSFSRRNSVWANSALVVNITPSDWQHHVAQHGPLAGVALQEEIEREAARRGGGDLKAPVQRMTDFLAGSVSQGTLPSSSYRLGVRSAALHDIYPPFVGAALGKALQKFERTIPGFMSSPEALLHGVETRTSAPVRVDRDPETLESTTLGGLFPSGEGAGYAGGIVSAAVDGMRVGQAILQALAPLGHRLACDDGW